MTFESLRKSGKYESKFHNYGTKKNGKKINLNEPIGDLINEHNCDLIDGQICDLVNEHICDLNYVPIENVYINKDDDDSVLSESSDLNEDLEKDGGDIHPPTPANTAKSITNEINVQFPTPVAKKRTPIRKALPKSESLPKKETKPKTIKNVPKKQSTKKQKDEELENAQQFTIINTNREKITKIIVELSAINDRENRENINSSSITKTFTC
jgi:hypothetical protein